MPEFLTDIFQAVRTTAPFLLFLVAAACGAAAILVPLADKKRRNWEEHEKCMFGDWRQVSRARNGAHKNLPAPEQHNRMTAQAAEAGILATVPIVVLTGLVVGAACGEALSFFFPGGLL